MVSVLAFWRRLGIEVGGVGYVYRARRHIFFEGGAYLSSLRLEMVLMCCSLSVSISLSKIPIQRDEPATMDWSVLVAGTIAGVSALPIIWSGRGGRIRGLLLNLAHRWLIYNKSTVSPGESHS